MTGPTAPAPPPPAWRRWAARLEFDGAVAWALGVRAWQVLAGPVTALLIASRFSVVQQDYFYTLTGLLALDAVCKLGVFEVLVALTAHSWGGDRRDLPGLTRFARRWAAGSGAAFVAGVGAFGAWSLSGRGAGPPGGWAGPWWVAAAATAGSTALVPALAVLTGCDRVRAVLKTQTAGAVLANAAAWAVMLTGGGLWAAAAACVGKLAAELWLIGRSRRFLVGLRGDGGAAFRWRAAVWPMQWRAAVQNAGQAAATTSLTLAPFTLGGPEHAGDAGRMGMSLSAALALQYAGRAWLGTRAPALGALAAAGEVRRFDRLFGRVAAVSGAAVALGGAGGCALLWGLAAWEVPLADRLLPVAPFAALVAGAVLGHVPLSLAAYARPWRAEAFVLPSAAQSAATVAAAWALAPAYGAAGVAWGSLAAVLAVGVPAHLRYWHRFRRALRRG